MEDLKHVLHEEMRIEVITHTHTTRLVLICNRSTDDSLGFCTPLKQTVLVEPHHANGSLVALLSKTSK